MTDIVRAYRPPADQHWSEDVWCWIDSPAGYSIDDRHGRRLRPLTREQAQQLRDDLDLILGEPG